MRRWGWLTAGVLVLALAGCTPDDGDPPPGSSPDPGGTYDGGGEDGGPVTLPPHLIECSEKEREGALPEVDLGAYEYVIPDGFVHDGPFHQFAPVEGEHVNEAIRLERNTGTIETLLFTYYAELEHGPVANECGVIDEDAVLERLTSYHAEFGAEVLEGPEAVTVAGHPAYMEVLEYNGRIQLRAYWVYGRHDLLHIECQWDVERAAIEAGCEELVDSLTFG